MPSLDDLRILWTHKGYFISFHQIYINYFKLFICFDVLKKNPNRKQNQKKSTFLLHLPQQGLNQGWLQTTWLKTRHSSFETKEHSVLTFSTVPKTRTHWQAFRSPKIYSRIMEVYTSKDAVSVYSKAKSKRAVEEEPPFSDNWVLIFGVV